MREAKWYYAALVVFPYLLAFAALIPTLPTIVESLVPLSPDVKEGDRDKLRTSRAIFYLGFIIGLNNLTTFLTSPIIGALSDRFGRVPLLRFASFGLSLDIAFILLALKTGQIAFVFVAHTLWGFFGGFFPVVYAYLSDTTDVKNRTRNFGLIGGLFGISFIISPVTFAILIGKLGYYIPLFIALGISLISFAIAVFIVPESIEPDINKRLTWNDANPFSSFWMLKESKIALGVCVAFFVMYFAEQGLFDIWVLYFKYKFDWDEMHTGIGLGCAGIGLVVSQGVLLPILSKRFSDEKIITIALFTNIATILPFVFLPGNWIFYTFLFLQTAGMMAMPTMQSFTTKQYPESVKGEILGVWGGVKTLSGVIGPPIASALFHYFTSKSSSVEFPGVVFVWSAVCFAIALGISHYSFALLRKREQSRYVPLSIYDQDERSLLASDEGVPLDERIN